VGTAQTKVGGKMGMNNPYHCETPVDREQLRIVPQPKTLNPPKGDPVREYRILGTQNAHRGKPRIPDGQTLGGDPGQICFWRLPERG